MAATMGGAWKAYLESLGLGVAVFRDGAPQDAEGRPQTTYPYVVVTEGVGYAPELHGDTDDPAGHLGTSELVQIDLYELARGAVDPATGRAVSTENYRLAAQLEAAIRRARPGLAVHAPWRVYGVGATAGQRWPVKGNVVRHTWTAAVRRDTEWKD